jgi:quinol monooxygenase YgiN
MSISLIVAGIGAIVAAVGFGMLMARCFRAPRGDLIAWSLALLGLAVGLVAQALGHLIGFGQLSFRAMEVGTQLIAPLALTAGLAELVARGVPGRFAARLFIPALGFVALVILGTDPLSGTAFTKAWPAPTVYYQLIPNKLLEYGVAPISLIVAIILVIIVAVRSGSEGQWRAVLLAAAAAAVAVVALVIPGLGAALGVTLPLSSLFAFLCLLAAGLTWYAGVSVERVPVAALRGGGVAAAGGRAGGRRREAGRGDADRGGARRAGAGRRDGAHDDRDGDDPGQDGWGQGRQRDGDDQTGDFASYDDGSQGVYRGGGLYRDEPSGARNSDGGRPGEDTGYGWQGRDGDYDSRELDSVYGPGGYDTGSLNAGYDTGSHDGYDTGAPPPVQRGPNSGDHAAPAGDLALAGLRADGVSPGARPPVRPETTRAQLFGQIAIYTLIEDRVPDFDLLTERVVGQVRVGEPDTLVFIVHAVPSAPMQRILYEVYKDRAAFDWHERQPYVTEFEADQRPYVLATNVIELGLQQAKVSPFPSIADLFGEPGSDTSGFERPDYTREYGSSAGQNGAPR